MHIGLTCSTVHHTRILLLIVKIIRRKLKKNTFYRKYYATIICEQKKNYEWYIYNHSPVCVYKPLG